MIFTILSAPWAFDPAPSTGPSHRSAIHCATGTETVQVSPAGHAATVCVRRRPLKTVTVRPRSSVPVKCDVDHTFGFRRHALGAGVSLPARMLVAWAGRNANRHGA